MHGDNLTVERAVKRQESSALTITCIYKPDVEAVLKVLAKLLSKAPHEKAQSECLTEDSVAEEETTNGQ